MLLMVENGIGSRIFHAIHRYVEANNFMIKIKNHHMLSIGL